jgi:hypothetical protein
MTKGFSWGTGEEGDAAGTLALGWATKLPGGAEAQPGRDSAKTATAMRRNTRRC